MEKRKNSWMIIYLKLDKYPDASLYKWHSFSLHDFFFFSLFLVERSTWLITLSKLKQEDPKQGLACSCCVFCYTLFHCIYKLFSTPIHVLQKMFTIKEEEQWTSFSTCSIANLKEISFGSVVVPLMPGINPIDDSRLLSKIK